MEKQRPRPEDLLLEAEEEERLLEKEEKGKLKIFFGAAPGVGKTYSMLSAALAKRTEGLDVVIGLVETHGRKETEDLIKNIEVLPRCVVDYRGRLLKEFDIDGAIKRHPALIIVDEMAHTNPASMRHAKRWQDIKELLDRGIDVYTTLNVQHIESLNDVIKQITGVRVRETIPDSALDLADSIELIDLPPDDLLERLEEGKIYIPEQAELAIQHFFRKRNLTALRELSLRYTAQRVNVQMQTQRRSTSDEKTYPTTERLLVCVDHTPFSVKLVRTARRLANSFQADWVAVYVDCTSRQTSEEARQLAIQNLRFAEQLGAKTEILSGPDIVKEIMEYARPHNITKMIIGKEIQSRWREALFKNLANELMRASHEIDVYIITGEKEEFLPSAESSPVSTKIKPKKTVWVYYFTSLLVVTVCTIINVVFNSFFGSGSLITIYLFGIIAISATGQRGPAFFASILSILAYAFFFVSPHLTFKVTDTQYVLALLVLLLVAQIVSQLAYYVKKQHEMIRNNSHRASTLYRLSMELASQRGMDHLLLAGITHIAEVFESQVLALMPDHKGDLMARMSHPKGKELDTKERSIAQWAYDLGQMTGLGTETLPFSNALYVPLQGASGKIGVLRIQPEKAEIFSIPEQMHLLETFIHQVVLSIEVDKLQEEARKDELKGEVEGLRNKLLIMTSHEIQIPLLAIQKTLNKLVKGIDQFEVEDIREFIKTIHKDSNQLNQIARALIKALRLEAGTVKMAKEPHAFEKIINAAVANLKSHFKSRTINIIIPDELPAVLCDFELIEQVMTSLIENALQSMSEDQVLNIKVEVHDNILDICIGEGGLGVPVHDIDSLFEKFYERRTLPKMSVSGLGLFISRSIIHLHGGKILVEEREDGGASFKLSLPIR